MISFGIFISVVRVGTTPALEAAVVACPKEVAEFASVARVAAHKPSIEGRKRRWLEKMQLAYSDTLHTLRVN